MTTTEIVFLGFIIGIIGGFLAKAWLGYRDTMERYDDTERRIDVSISPIMRVDNPGRNVTEMVNRVRAEKGRPLLDARLAGLDPPLPPPPHFQVPKEPKVGALIKEKELTLLGRKLRLRR